jgi:hypothetical protein
MPSDNLRRLMPKPVAETRARVNAHARETDTQFMEQLEFQAAQAAWED